MGDNKEDTIKKLQLQRQKQHQHQQQTQQLLSSSPKDPLEETTESKHHHHHQSQGVVVTGASFISAPVFVPIGAPTASSFDQQYDAATAGPKRPRYGTSGQWKLLPSPSSQQKQTQMGILNTESTTPSPTTKPTNLQAHTAASSSDTASSPTNSPIHSLSAASGQETSKPSEGEQFHHQFRKGKYVSPVWKPNEMLWLARAWRVHYQRGSDGPGSASRPDPPHLERGQIVGDTTVQSTRGKTRADKDKEVADFLNRHGVDRDAKTAGTKWDNMLGEFRKVYEWERGGEREQVGKSYFRLSPYERKLHRLPASFDEEVFEELSQFMGPRMRTPSRGATLISSGDDSCRGTLGGINSTKSLPPPSPFKDEDLPLSGREKQLTIVTSGAEQYQTYLHSGRGVYLGFDPSHDTIRVPSSSTSMKELRRIGKIRMTWEESVSLWAEEGEYQRGRIRVQGSSFLNADELTFFDDSMVPCTIESFEDGPFKGLSVDRFYSGQQVKVFGRRNSSSSAISASKALTERVQLPLMNASTRLIPSWDIQDPSEYYMGSLRLPPATLPSLLELSWHLQTPPPEELRFPIRKEVYRDLPQGKELFFIASSELLDSRSITFDLIAPIVRTIPTLSTVISSRESLIGLWDDIINRIICKFCSMEMVFVRKPSSRSSTEMQDQWPNLTGFVKNFCLWRGDEIDQSREGQIDPSSSIVEKVFWSYLDLPYILGYYAIGYTVTFCALSKSQDRIIRTDLYSLDLSSPSDRLKALIPCYRIAGLLSLLADRCTSNSGNGKQFFAYSDFERIDFPNNYVMEMTPNTVTKIFSSKRKWGTTKGIYDFLDHRIPHAEFIYRESEKDLKLIFKPRGCRFKPTNSDQLVESLKYVTKALVALHDLSFMHRDLSWDKVLRRTDTCEAEWFVAGFDEAVGSPQLYPYGIIDARGRHAPEMGKGLHGVKVDVWGMGHLIKTSGLTHLPKLLRELQNKCLDPNPDQRPTVADCYHHLLQVQSSAGAPY